MERSYMLDTQYATQKSFGGKAVVEVWRNNLGLDYELLATVRMSPLFLVTAWTARISWNLKIHGRIRIRL